MVNLRIHFPSGKSLKYPNIDMSELIDNEKTIGYEDKDAEVTFNKAVIAGYVITKVKE